MLDFDIIHYKKRKTQPHDAGVGSAGYNDSCFFAAEKECHAADDQQCHPQTTMAETTRNITIFSFRVGFRFCLSSIRKKTIFGFCIVIG